MTTRMDLIELIARQAHPITGSSTDYDSLLEIIGNAHFVFLGESTHGTHEFYQARAEITRRLIQERGFRAVAVEADWPDAYRVNRYVRSQRHSRNEDRRSIDALGDFTQFPLWVWRNAVVLDFIGWLRDFNQRLDARHRVGFYGLDLYSLYASVASVIEYLEQVDPQAGNEARRCYGLLGQLRSAAAMKQENVGSLAARRSCEDAVTEHLIKIRQQEAQRIERASVVPEDEQFQAEQNAYLIRNAKDYYGAMLRSDITTWDLRSHHMVETLEALAHHLSRWGRPARVVVWGHNSHIGDSRATLTSPWGKISMGQLMREKRHKDVVLVGFTTHQGTVSAASQWQGEVERKRLRPALPGSCEAVLHDSRHERLVLPLTDANLREKLNRPRLQRAIGVIYEPEHERSIHYFETCVADQFDAIIHFDKTRAVEPLDQVSGWETDWFPDTYPYGL